jgi:hypothetical protein
MLATATFSIGTCEAPVTGRFPLADRPHRVRRTAKRAPAAGSVCLVVSDDPLKQLMFGQAAKRAGWKSVVCADRGTALEHVEAGTVGLALVDTANSDSDAVANNCIFAERLSAHKNILSVICGRSNDAHEELWARELGAWMYLPGVAPESDLDPILQGAREVAQRLNKQPSPACVGMGFDC